MADKSAIEWTDATWTPIRARRRIGPKSAERFSDEADAQKTGKLGWHCEHVSEGCRVCYAEGINRRLGTGLDFKPGHRGDIELFLDETMLTAPLRWKRPRMIFVCSMTDLFADFVPDEWIDKMFAVMALCPQHTFQVLTKRSARMRGYMTEMRVAARIVDVSLSIPPQHSDDVAVFNATWPLPNVWLGVSCEDQENAAARIPDLLATPAAVRFVSAEPLLGPIDFADIGEISFSLNAFTGEGRHLLGMRGKLPGLDWIIVGGESGREARPPRIGWVRSIRDQCAAARVAFFFKQWGEFTPDDPAAVQTSMRRVGKKAAGRLLDGHTHDAMPAGADVSSGDRERARA